MRVARDPDSTENVSWPVEISPVKGGPGYRRKRVPNHGPHYAFGAGGHRTGYVVGRIWIPRCGIYTPGECQSAVPLTRINPNGMGGVTSGARAATGVLAASGARASGGVQKFQEPDATAGVSTTPNCCSPGLLLLAPALACQ